jgi:hypothetical protein
LDVGQPYVKSVELQLHSGDELQMQTMQREIGGIIECDFVRTASLCGHWRARNQAVAQEPPRHPRVELRAENNQRRRCRHIFDHALVTLIPRTLDAIIHASGAEAGEDAQYRSVERTACKPALTASGAECSSSGIVIPRLAPALPEHRSPFGLPCYSLKVDRINVSTPGVQ